jgi:hypothetical protein
MTPQTQQEKTQSGNAPTDGGVEPQPATTGSGEPTPSICRSVVYRDGDGTQWPAIIQTVNKDGTLDLAVFRAQHFIREVRIAEGDAARQWSWPPRV